MAEELQMDHPVRTLLYELFLEPFVPQLKRLNESKTDVPLKKSEAKDPVGQTATVKKQA